MAVGERPSRIVPNAQRRKNDRDHARHRKDRVAVVRRENARGDDLNDQNARSRDEHGGGQRVALKKVFHGLIF